MDTPDTPKPKNVPEPVPIPEVELEEFLEWTIEEEQAFLDLLDDMDQDH